jgi:hypothetical protein
MLLDMPHGDELIVEYGLAVDHEITDELRARYPSLRRFKIVAKRFGENLPLPPDCRINIQTSQSKHWLRSARQDNG